MLDIESADHAQLVAELQGVDAVVSTIFPLPHLLQAQKLLARAAKEAGVARFVPSNWATACPRGVMKLHDLVRPIFFSCIYARVDFCGVAPR